MLYTTFTVKENDYKCRLSAKACVDLERKMGTNPLNVFTKIAANSNAQTGRPGRENFEICHKFFIFSS